VADAQGATKMTEEFRKTAANTAVSSNGFTVQWIPHGGIRYQDASGEVRIDSESLVMPYRVLLYPQSASLRNLSKSCQEELLGNVKRALEHMGHQVEIWDVQTWSG
jgi:hypothetical protein